VLWEWRSLPHVAVSETYQKDRGDVFDYFHVNSAGFDSDGHLIVSARNTWTVYKVHRGTGEVLWRLGGRRSDFRMGRGTQFAFQHDARSHERGRLISLFDNGPRPNTRPQSRAVVIALDEAHMRATLRGQILHSPPLFAFATGNSQALPNGNTLVCWGTTGTFTEYDPHGKPLLNGRLPRGGQNYRVRRFPWVGTPRVAPVLASRRGGLHVSWNGATEVASWQVRSGSSANALTPVSTTPRTGFETVLPRPADRVAVAVALDREGRVLGRSKPLRL
jgi:hypothetical protein